MGIERGSGLVSTRHVGALDGLRGLAVVAVVAYHLHWLSGGFLGVDVFFVLSGYLVTTLVLAEVERTERLDLRGFWTRRIRRLLPAVLVLVPAVLIGALAIGWSPTRLGSLATDAIATLTWWANWRQASGTSYWAPGPSPFRHAWSLSIEEQFYVAWPIVVAALAMLGRRFGWSVRRAVGVVAGLGALASTVRMVLLARSLPGADLSRAYLGTDTRILAPLAGCALACWLPQRGSAERFGTAGRRAFLVLGHVALGLLVVLAVAVEVPDPSMYRNGGFLLAAISAASLVWALAALDPAGDAIGRTGALGLLALRPVRHLGSRSYAIYLWSWPVQALIEVWRPTWSRLEVTAVVVALALVAAELSFVAVEEPFRRGRGWARWQPVRKPAWGLAIALPLVALLLVRDRAVPPPAFERIDTAESVKDASHAPPPVISQPSKPGAAAAPRGLRVMVEGDSVAFMAAYRAPGGAERPAGIESIDGRGVIGCGLLASAHWDYPRRSEPGYAALPACDGQADAERIGLTGKPDVVLVIAGAWEYQSVRNPDGHVVEAQTDEMRDVLVDALLTRGRAAHAAGASLAIAEWSCPGAQASPERRDPAYIRWVNRVFAEAVRKARAEGITATVLAPTEKICANADPTGQPTDAWRSATGDEVHVRTEEGGELLWNAWLAPALTTFRPL
jgi:peptidoglycan/LPS O-acetylase OafA/YrhL